MRSFLELVAAVGVALSTAASAAGPYSVLNQEPSTQVPYPGSLWTQPLPADIMNHRAPNSEAIARNHLESNDNPGGPPIPLSQLGQMQAATPGFDEGGFPHYYGQASDPVYTVTSCNTPPAPSASPIGIGYHIPNGACFSGGYSDKGFQVWDQVTNRILSLYGPYGSYPNGTQTCLPACPPNCNIASDIARYCGGGNYTTGPATGWVSAASLGNGAWSMDIRLQEWMDGIINHPLYLITTCTVGHQFPSPGDTTQCANVNPPNDGSRRAANGALIFLDYTDAQINAMGLPAWQKPLVRAMSRYGGYIGDTGAVYQTGLGITAENSAAWAFIGQTNPFYAWLAAQPGVECFNGNPPGSACRYNMYWAANIPLVNGTDIRSHIHVADVCVPLGLAGQPGGCVAPGPTLPAPTNLRLLSVTP